MSDDELARQPVLGKERRQVLVTLRPAAVHDLKRQHLAYPSSRYETPGDAPNRKARERLEIDRRRRGEAIPARPDRRGRRRRPRRICVALYLAVVGRG